MANLEPLRREDLPQYEPTSTMGNPGRASQAERAATNNASPSASGMKPLVASAIVRNTESSMFVKANATERSSANMEG